MAMHGMQEGDVIKLHCSDKEAIEELQFVRNDMPAFKEKDSEVTPTWQLTMRNICPEFYRES